MLRTYDHSLIDLSTETVTIHQQNELTKPNKIFIY